VSFVPTVLAAVLLAGLVSLGLWQLRRAEEKTQLIERATSRAEDPPYRLGSDSVLPSEAMSKLEFRRVVATGRYDSVHQYLLDNRTHAGQAGFEVLTQLELGRGTGVLVNRGWIASSGHRDRLPVLPVPVGPVEVSGQFARPRENRLVLGPSGYEEAAAWPRIVQRIELDPMSKALGHQLVPLVVLLDPSSPDGFERDWRPHLGISPARHWAYAFQWFALAAALVVLYIFHARRSPGTRAVARRNR